MEKKKTYKVFDDDGNLLDTRKTFREYTHAVVTYIDKHYPHETEDGKTDWKRPEPCEPYILGKGNVSYCGSLELAQKRLDPNHNTQKIFPVVEA